MLDLYLSEKKTPLSMDTLKYNLRGVSASKEDVHNAIKNIDKGLYPKAFCKIIPDFLGGDPNYCNIMHADGAGTKSSLAYLYWKETGDLSVWKGIAQDALIMNIDDLICVGAVDNILVSSTIGRNKLLVPGEVISAIINGTDELLAELREMGIGVYATGGETADIGNETRITISPIPTGIKNLGYDEWNADENATLTIDEMQSALKDAGTFFDFIGMDCCIMSSLEVCCALYDFCDYMILSEDFESGLGWYYTDFINAMNNNPDVFKKKNEG